MLTVHRGERADALVERLVEVLAAEPADPFVTELVAVPTRGVERWLTHRLADHLGAGAHGDGICANVEFPFPGRLITEVLARSTGVDVDHDPWRSERLVWPTLEVLDARISEPWLALVAEHVGRGPRARSGGTTGRADAADHRGQQSEGDDPLRRSRRLDTARHLADLYDRYGIHRPEMIRAWHQGLDQDGLGSRLPQGAEWQARLWRELRAHVGTPSPPERTAQACAALADGRIDDGLPRRISLFGLTRLPMSYLDVLRALAVGHDVHLYALHPSSALWERLAPVADGPWPRRRADDRTRDVVRNPLLRSWGDDTREMQLVLTATGDRDAPTGHLPHDRSTQAPTLLSRIQDDIRADREPAAGALEVAADDRSLQVHDCHGRARQVEVLRDTIGHLLADDPTLEPRDVVVLCPDVDDFAPLVHATFGAPLVDLGTDGVPAQGPGTSGDEPEVSAGGVPRIPYRLADRSLRQTNTVLGALSELLDLVDSRFGASQVLEFLARPPVRARFGFDDDDLELIASWVADTGIRWGLDRDQRARWSLPHVTANTWRAGLDRLLVGVTMDESEARLVEGVLPLDDLDSGRIDLAGRLAEAIGRLGGLAEACLEPRAVGEWVLLLRASADALFRTTGDTAWQQVQLGQVLDTLVSESTTHGRACLRLLSLTEVRSLLADRLRGVPTRADFRTGAVTLCTLVPMRAVPHRVVCLLGIDDGVFPRRAEADGDDLLRQLPLVGDQDRRAEDRQLLLDAVLSATDHLVITYTGRDERTNEPRPPAVPVSELLDVVSRTGRTVDGGSPLDLVWHHHRLQAFDPVNFGAAPVDALPHAGVGRVPTGFDADAAAGAAAVLAPRHHRRAFLDNPLPPARDAVVGLDDLTRFLQHPVREFLRQRLGLNTWEADDSTDDRLTIEMDALAQWSVGQRLLDQVLAGQTLDAACRAEQARGSLPPGEIGHRALRVVADQVHTLAGDIAAAGLVAADGTSPALPDSSVGIDVELGETRSLVGTVAAAGTTAAGDTATMATYSRPGARHRLDTWLRLLALTAARPEVAWGATLVGRGRRGAHVLRLAALAGTPVERQHRARTILEQLVELRDMGLREPLPMPLRTAEAWAVASHRGENPRRSADREWTTAGRNFDGEDRDRAHVRVFGRDTTLDDLLAVAPVASEQGVGWAEDELSRLGRLARRLWDPYLDHTATTDRRRSR